MSESAPHAWLLLWGALAVFLALGVFFRRRRDQAALWAGRGGWVVGFVLFQVLARPSFFKHFKDLDCLRYHNAYACYLIVSEHPESPEAYRSGCAADADTSWRADLCAYEVALGERLPETECTRGALMKPYCDIDTWNSVDQEKHNKHRNLTSDGICRAFLKWDPRPKSMGPMISHCVRWLHASGPKAVCPALRAHLKPDPHADTLLKALVESHCRPN